MCRTEQHVGAKQPVGRKQPAARNSLPAPSSLPHTECAAYGGVCGLRRSVRLASRSHAQSVTIVPPCRLVFSAPPRSMKPASIDFARGDRDWAIFLEELAEAAAFDKPRETLFRSIARRTGGDTRRTADFYAARCEDSIDWNGLWQQRCESMPASLHAAVQRSAAAGVLPIATELIGESLLQNWRDTQAYRGRLAYCLLLAAAAWLLSCFIVWQNTAIIVQAVAVVTGDPPMWVGVLQAIRQWLFIWSWAVPVAVGAGIWMFRYRRGRDDSELANEQLAVQLADRLRAASGDESSPIEQAVHILSVDRIPPQFVGLNARSTRLRLIGEAFVARREELLRRRRRLRRVYGYGIGTTGGLLFVVYFGLNLLPLMWLVQRSLQATTQISIGP